jgi:hypothetical protein
MEFWTEIRRRVLAGELSKRAASREYDLHWDTLKKILEHVESPGYRHSQPRSRPTVEPFLETLHEILDADKKAPKKPHHTAIRIFERLRDEHGCTGGYSAIARVFGLAFRGVVPAHIDVVAIDRDDGLAASLVMPIGGQRARFFSFPVLRLR